MTKKYYGSEEDFFLALWRKIKGEAMDAVVNSLPTVEIGNFHVINTKDEDEGNNGRKVVK